MSDNYVEDLYEYTGNDPAATEIDDLYEAAGESEVADLYEFSGVKPAAGATWGDVGESMVESFQPNINQMVGGIAQRSGEVGAEEARQIIEDPEAEVDRRYGPRKAPGYNADLMAAFRFGMTDEEKAGEVARTKAEAEADLGDYEARARTGKQMRDRASDQLYEARPDFSEDDWGKELVYDTGMAIEKLAPAAGIGALANVATGGGLTPVILGTGAFMAGVKGDAYGEARTKERTVQQADFDSTVSALIEGGTEALVFGRLWSMGGPVIRKVLDVTVGEGLSESVSSILQQAYDNNIIHPEMSLGEAMAAIDWGDVGHEFAVGSLMGLALGGANVPVNYAAEKRAIQQMKSIAENVRFDGLTDGALAGLITEGGRLARYHRDAELADVVEAFKAEADLRKAGVVETTQTDTSSPLNQPPPAMGEVDEDVDAEALIGAEEAPTTEPEDTIQAQMTALQEGRKRAVYIPEGQEIPDVPEGFAWDNIAGRGTLIHAADDTEALTMFAQGRVGTVLDYGVDEKPDGATDVVTARDADGTVIQDVVTDGSPEIEAAAERVAGPEGSVETRSSVDAIAERQAGLVDQEAPAGEQQADLSPTDEAQADADFARQQARIVRGKHRAAQAKKINDTDSLGAMIAKLGGINTDEAVADGFDPADMKKIRSGIMLAFNKGAKSDSVDGMREALNQFGWDFATSNDLLNALREEVAGNNQYTAAGLERKMEQEAAARQEAAEMAEAQSYWEEQETDPSGRPMPPIPVIDDGIYQESEPGEVYNPEWDSEARLLRDLYGEATHLAPEQAEEIWESGGSDGEIAARLYKLIREKEDGRKQEGEERDQEARATGSADGQMAQEETFAAAEGQEADLLGDNTEAAQEVADKQREKDEQRDQKGKAEPALVQAEDELFANEGKLPPDLFDQPAPKKPTKSNPEDSGEKQAESSPSEEETVPEGLTEAQIKAVAPVGSYVLYQDELHRESEDFSGIVYVVDKVLDGYIELKDIRDKGRRSTQNASLYPTEIRDGVLIDDDTWMTPVDAAAAAAFIEDDRKNAAETKAYQAEMREQYKDKFIPKQVKRLEKVSVLRELLWHIGASMTGTQAQLFRRYKDMAAVVSEYQYATAEELESMSAKALEDLSTKLGLAKSGNKGAKAARILERMALVHARVGKTRGDILNDPVQLKEKIQWIREKISVFRSNDVQIAGDNEAMQQWYDSAIDQLSAIDTRLSEGRGEQADLDMADALVKIHRDNLKKMDLLVAKKGKTDQAAEAARKNARWDKLNAEIDALADNELIPFATLLLKKLNLIKPAEAKRLNAVLGKLKDDPAKLRDRLKATYRMHDATLKEGAEAPKKPAEKRRLRVKKSKNTVFKDDEAQAALERLRKKMGQLNAGLDPESMRDGIFLAGHTIESGARTFGAYAKAMLELLGDVIKPYLRSWYEAVRYDPNIDTAGMTPVSEMDDAVAILETEGQADDADTTESQAGDRPDAGDQAPVDAGAVQPDGRGVGEGVVIPDGYPTQAGLFDEGDTGVPGAGTAVAGEPGSTGIFTEDGRPRIDGPAGGPDQPGASTGTGAAGISDGTEGADAARRAGFSYHATLSDKRKAQAEANKLPQTIGDLANIHETLPFLLPEQREDVKFAEDRWLSGGVGVMFTNGTGTGKTYTGLGIIRRHITQTGDDNVLLLVPSDTKAKDWIEDGLNLGIEITQLKDKKDKGKGVVITTYANFRDNWELQDRDFSMVMPDESHRISQSATDKGSTFTAFRAIASHKDGLYSKAMFRHPEAKELEYGRRRYIEQRIREVEAELASGELDPVAYEAIAKAFANKQEFRKSASEEWLNRNEKAYAKVHKEVAEQAKSEELLASVGTSRVVFLSASPFAYHQSLDYGEGYLFSFPEEENEGGFRGPDSRSQFFITNFGYQWKYHKLNQPPAEVDVGLMERRFTEGLKESGALRGRTLEVDYDYSRDFVLFNSDLGEKVDRGINVLRGLSPEGERLSKDEMMEKGYPVLTVIPQVIDRKLTAIYLSQLSEAIKADGLVTRVQAHLDLGRKVVVFHDFQRWEHSHPFDLSDLEPPRTHDDAQQTALMMQLREEIDAFHAAYPELRNLPLGQLKSVVETLSESFGERAVMFNGTVTNRNKKLGRDLFQKDHSQTDIIVVQRQSGREGISLHDVTGVHQRVLLDMGLPVAPVDSIQTEGRVYRVGVMSNAAIEYPVLHTNFEQYMFATRIAERARTAENLAMGSLARTMDVSFREGYIQASEIEPTGDQGTGGKQRDRALRTEKPFDVSKTLYYARQKRSGRRDQREGIDYFSTPEPLGMKMVEWASIRGNDRALEPSAGHGAIARWFPEDSRNVFVEPSAKLASEVQLLSNGEAKVQRFEDLSAGSKYDAVVMNPPFGSGGKTAMEHLEKAMGHLKNGGRIVALIPTGPMADKRFDKLIYGAENELAELKEGVKKGMVHPKKYEQRRRQLEDFHLITDMTLPAVTFGRAGTNVATRIVILDRYNNPADVPLQHAPVNWSGYEDINDFFDAIRDVEVRPRNPVTVKEADEAPSPEITQQPNEVMAGGRRAVLEKAFHHRRQKNIWRVQIKGARLPRSDYLALNDKARARAGYYSAFRGNGALPGFVFNTQEDANAFLSDFYELFNDGSVAEDADFYRVEEYGEKGYSGLQPETKSLVDNVLEHTENPDTTRALLDKYKGTAWAKQAIAGARVKSALADLLQGKEPAIDSLFNSPRSHVIKNAIRKRGPEAIWAFLKTSAMSHPSKPINSVNGSFLNCEPSDSCAEFCYAATGRNYASIVIRAELTDWAVSTDPVRFGKLVAEEYKATPEFAAGKALRLFERGDGHGPWVQFIETLNAEGVRAHVFSKRPDFLRQVPEQNVRLLSIDASNKALAEQNKDLPVSYVYNKPAEIKWLNKFKLQGGKVQVILPIVEGRRKNPENVAKLPKWTKPLTCPVDKGSVKIGKGAKEWNCTRCDNGGGVGCYNRNTTSRAMQGYSLPLEDIQARPSFEGVIDEIRELSGRLDLAGQAGLLQELDIFLREARTRHDPETEAGGRGSVPGPGEAEGPGGDEAPADGGRVVREPKKLYVPSEAEIARDPVAAATRSVESLRRPELWGGGTLLANGIARDFTAESKTNLIGKKVSSHEDLATLAQIYRNPSFETFRLFMLREGRVVGQTAVTSRMPGSAMILAQKGKDWTVDIGLAELQAQMDAVGADAYYILHNHPSGNPTPSNADRRVTKTLSGQFSQLMLGHVVIDHDTYSFMDRSGDPSVRPLPQRAIEGRDTYDNSIPKKGHPLLGMSITSPDALALLAYDLKSTAGYFQLIGTNRNGVSGILEVPVSVLTRDRLRLTAQVRKFMRQTGSLSVFAVNVPVENMSGHKAKWLDGMRTDLLTDIMDVNGNSAQKAGYSAFPNMEAGRLGNKGYEVRDEAPEYATPAERQSAFLHALRQGQPLDAVFRIPFNWIGSIDNSGAWHPPRIAGYTKDKAAALLDKAADKTYEHLPWAKDMVETAKAGLIDRYGLDERYKARDAERQAQEYGIAIEGMDLIQKMADRGVDTAEAQVLHAILTGEAPSTEQWQSLTDEIRTAVDELGLEAVRLGLIKREVFERNRTTYLHRVYKKHEGQKGIGKFVQAFANMRRKKIVGNTFKGRGLTLKVDQSRLLKDVPPDWFGSRQEAGKADKQLKGKQFIIFDLHSNVGQGVQPLPFDQGGRRPRVKQRVFWPADKPVPARFDAWENKGTWEVRGTRAGKLILWRDFTKDERVRMGEIVDARYTIAKTFQLMSKDLSAGRMLADIATNESWTWQDADPPHPDSVADARERSFRTYVGKEWVRVPSSKIEGTDVHRWGALAGKYVRPEIWRDLNELDRMQNPGTWRKVLSQWKLNKTARNPVVHLNNVMSNVLLMDMADVRFQDMGAAWQAMRTRDEHYQDAMRHGAFGGSFILNEIQEDVLNPLLDELLAQNVHDRGWFERKVGRMGKIMDILIKYAVALDKKGISIYQLEDNIFRMATYIRRRAIGDSAEEAARMAREQFLNYDIRAPWVNLLRNTVLPFLSYTYRAVPVIADSIARRPWKLAKYATAAYAANWLAYALSEGDEDEERRSLRDTEQGNVWLPGVPRMMRMPWNDANNNPVFLDIRRWIPAGDVFDLHQGQVPWVPAPLQMGGPLALAFELHLNKSAFTGDEIWNNKTDTAGDIVGKTADWAYKSWMPSAPWVPNSWYWNKIGNALSGARDSQGRPYQLGYALTSSIGIKLRPQDVTLNFAWKGRDYESMKSDLGLQMRLLQRDKTRGLISGEAYQEERQHILDKLGDIQRSAEETFTPQR